VLASTIVAVVLLVVWAAPASALGAAWVGVPAKPIRPPRAIARVLVVSVPAVGWADVRREHARNLERLLGQSAVANMTVRSGGGGPAASYLTLGAGKRSMGTGTASDGMAFGVHDRFGASTAGEAYSRRTGRRAGAGLVDLGINAIQNINDAEPGGTSVGALGSALRAGGYRTAVIGNPDGSTPDDGLPRVRRYAIGGLMTASGRVSDGRVDDGLLVPDGSAPFGVRLDDGAVVAAFREVWTGLTRGVVMVEASDMNRAVAARSLMTPSQGDKSYAAALRRSDALVGQLLAAVDPGRDAVVVVSPAGSPTTRGLTVVGVRAPGVAPGVMKSGSTRRKGFVLLADVAPTILQLAHLPRPKSMNGRPFSETSGHATAAQRAGRLRSATDAALFRDRLLKPVTYLTTAVAAAVALAAVLAWETRRRWAWRGIARFGASWLLAFVPAVYVARLFAFHRAGNGPYYLFVVGLAVAFALVYEVAGSRDPITPTILGLGGIVMVIVLDLLTGARLQLSSPFGYTPTIGVRFSGIGNVAYSFFAASAVLLAGLLAHRVGGRRGAWVAVAVMAVALIADAAPMLGGDVGGALSMTPAFLVAALLLFGARIRLRAVIAAVAAAAVAVVVMSAIDLARPAKDRTHLGRLLTNTQQRGPGELTGVIHRKLDANLHTWSTSPWRVMFAIGVLFVIYLAWRRRSQVRVLLGRVPELRAALIGFAIVIVLGYALNDSGVAIPAVMFVVLISALVGLMMRGLDQANDTARVEAATLNFDSLLAATPPH
jgi:hypothetical protein